MGAEENRRITINPGVRSGQPIIRGTRTTVADILSLLASGAPQEEILSDFPWLTPADVSAALEYKHGDARNNSASEVVREALRLLEEHDSARAAQLAEFNGELGRRLASLDGGETIDPAEARARLQNKSAERRRKPRA
jgi:uncharacterized protein (DUF433 family)